MPSKALSRGNPLSLFRDVRFSLRALRKTPAFTIVAIVTVALTVGTTTAIFSVVYGVLLRQFPYRNVEQVFWIWSDQPGRDRTPFNVPDFIDYRDSTRALLRLAGFFAFSGNLSDVMGAQSLAVTGIYAVVLYSVGQRAREIAIRMALGASRSSIVRLLMDDGVRFILVGLVAGIAIAIGATRLLSTMLFGIAATDAGTYGQVAAIVAVVSGFACAVPAVRRGMSVADALPGE